MMEEEGVVMGGLLVGLNVIDANLCIKGEDLDSQVSPGRIGRGGGRGYTLVRALSEAFLFSHLGGSHRFLSVSERPSQQRDSERVSGHIPQLNKHVLDLSNGTICLFFSDSKMTAILDQKHYIEELNRHLSGTVTDLQAKMDSLEKTNSKLVEEVRCAHVS